MYEKESNFLAISALMLVGCNSGGTAEDIAKKTVESSLNGDIDTYYTLMAPDYIDYMVGENGWYDDAEEFKEELTEFEQEDTEDIADDCGEDFEYQLEIVETINADEETLEDVKDELSSDYDYNSDSIEDAAIITVGIDASGSEGKNRYTYDVSAVKINGKWYCHRPGITSM